jgi:branched-chain amino acid transport system permease protein
MTNVLLETATLTAIYAVLTLSLNLQYGLTGLLNFGQGFFFALGGYSVGVVYFHDWPVWMGVTGAPLVGALGGFLLALPARRLDDHYWALMTLGVTELFLAIMNNESGIAGGDLGTYGIPRKEASTLLPIMILVVVVILIAFEIIRRSQFGRLIRIAREDHVLLAAIGRDLFRFQIAVLMVGGAVAAIAGVAIAYWLTVVAPDVFSLDQTVIVWAMLIVGGRGNNYGAVLGALVLEGIFIGTRFLPDIGPITGENFALLRILIVGLSLVLVLMFRTEGALPERKIRHRREAQAQAPASQPATANAPVS